MKRWPIWPLIALTFALVLLPASSQVIRPEVARWHLAIAHDSLVDTAYHRTQLAEQPRTEKHLAGYKRSLAKAEKAIERASKWGGKTSEYYSIRSRLHREKGNDRQARDDLVNAANESSPRSAWRRVQELANFEWRSDIKSALSHSLNAIALAEALDLSLERAELLNDLAYNRAVARIDLDEALKNIDEAIEIFDSSGLANIESPLVMLRDTRGFILFRLGRRAEARKEFDVIWEYFEDWKTEQLTMVRETKRTEIDIRTLRAETRARARSIAVIMNHRSQVLDSVKDADEIRALHQEILAFGVRPGPGLN
jgi:tetratricopeptide (TPR) repeat protein